MDLETNKKLTNHISLRYIVVLKCFNDSVLSCSGALFEQMRRNQNSYFNFFIDNHDGKSVSLADQITVIENENECLKMKTCKYFGLKLSKYQ